MIPDYKTMDHGRQTMSSDVRREALDGFTLLPDHKKGPDGAR